MVSKFHPDLNKVYFINKYTLLHILDGAGSIEVDFKNYTDWDDKLIFLGKGQYVKFLSPTFVVRKIEFEDEIAFRNNDVRVLFKHIVSLGYINFSECSNCQAYLSNTVFSSHASDIIDVSSNQWYWQNPFHANKEEYNIIFDVKEVIDEEYKNNLSNSELVNLINLLGLDAQSLFKTKVGLSVKSMVRQKRFLESQKAIAFTQKSIQEIAYEMGYKDPAYFSRLFQTSSGQNPLAFRESFDFEHQDLFLQDIYALLQQHHLEKQSVGFYASQMHMSVKTLSIKLRQKLNASMSQLIRQEVISSAKILLKKGIKVREASEILGFEEANHFSAFFKRYTGHRPSEHVD